MCFVLKLSPFLPRRMVAAVLLAWLALATPMARGEPTLADLRARMDALQDRLDATTQRLEELRSEEDAVRHRINEIELRVEELEDRRDRLSSLAAKRASLLYRQGQTGLLEAVIESEDFGEMIMRAELAETVATHSNSVFTRLARDGEEMDALAGELEERRAELAVTTSDLDDVSEELQAQFEEVGEEYRALKKQLAAAAAREREETVAAPDAAGGSGTTAAPAPTGGGRVCPVDGPVSFVDSWGAPRAGHTHVGVDMMADYGTPLVAIVSGTLSSGWSDTGGNSLFLSGDDGNSYWYLHNQENLVTSGHVSAGQQIATVGDTGNAVGIPHVHFEYHPGGGGPVNPYPLVAAIC